MFAPNSDFCRRWMPPVLALALGLGLGLIVTSEPSESVQSRPDLQLSRAEFRTLIEDLSEPEGYFDTDNFISNETSYLHVVPALVENVNPGGVYFGVGPDQNFSYIVHNEPSFAIIADIRRQNMLQHLLFKVLIEEARDRYDFLCRLFSRDCQPIDGGESLGEILRAVGQALRDARLLGRNVEHVKDVLLREYGLSLDEFDLERIEYVYRSFFDGGPAIRFSTFGRPSLRYPTYAELIHETDVGDRLQSYLSDERLFQRLQRFHRENRLIPIVGDFAGSHALPAAANYLKERGLEVSIFYTSNVEFYLFDLPEWSSYVANVRRFPFAEDAVFIRSYFPTFGRIHPQNQPGHRPTSLIQSVRGFLEDAEGGGLRSYWDVVSRHLLPY